VQHESAGFRLKINLSPHKMRISLPQTGVKNSRSGGPERWRPDWRIPLGFPAKLAILKSDFPLVAAYGLEAVPVSRLARR
jgi:hypothetical protein